MAVVETKVTKDWVILKIRSKDPLIISTKYWKRPKLQVEPENPTIMQGLRALF